MSENKDIRDIQLAALQREQEENDAKNHFMTQNMANDPGRALVAVFALFMSFLRNPEEINISENKTAKNLFTSLGFSKGDFEYTNNIGRKLKNKEISPYKAAKSVFERIKNPEKTLSTQNARDAVENVVPYNAPNLGSAGYEVINQVTSGEATDRQKAVILTIPKASEIFHVPADVMKGMWGIESSYGKDRVSDSNCQGDWQFDSKTWNSITSQYGQKVATALQEDFPDIAKDIRNNHNTPDALNKYKDHPVVSTYFACALAKDNSDRLGIDISKPENHGLMYTLHNSGLGFTKKLIEREQSGDHTPAKNYMGIVAENNGAFYKGNADASMVLTRQSTILQRRTAEFYKKFGSLENEMIAKAKQNNKSNLQKQFENGSGGGKDPKQPPVILTAEHKKVMKNGGVNGALVDESCPCDENNNDGQSHEKEGGEEKKGKNPSDSNEYGPYLYASSTTGAPKAPAS